MAEPTDDGELVPLSSKERRIFPRAPARARAAFRPLDEPEAPGIPITLIDISEGGASFSVVAALAVGQLIVLDLHAADDSAESRTVRAEVRWVVPNSKTGKARVGCAWAQPCNIFDLRRFF